MSEPAIYYPEGSSTLDLILRKFRFCGACVYWDRRFSVGVGGYGADPGWSAFCPQQGKDMRNDSSCPEFSPVLGKDNWPPQVRWTGGERVERKD